MEEIVGARDFITSKPYRPALGPTQHLIRWVSGFFLWSKTAETWSGPLTTI